jgi:hypothetical protein
MTAGRLPEAATASVNIERMVPLGGATASRITVNYPFTFMVLNPVARLVASGPSPGAPFTMVSSALMRNE